MRIPTDKLPGFWHAKMKSALATGRHIETQHQVGKAGHEAMLEWAYGWAEKTGKPVLIIAPLVMHRVFQVCAANRKMTIHFPTMGREVQAGVNVINWEKLHRSDTSQRGGLFEPAAFVGIALVLDELMRPTSFANYRKKALVAHWIKSIPACFIITFHPTESLPVRWLTKVVNNG